jgi:hypothetical protein
MIQVQTDDGENNARLGQSSRYHPSAKPIKGKLNKSSKVPQTALYIGRKNIEFEQAQNAGLLRQGSAGKLIM